MSACGIRGMDGLGGRSGGEGRAGARERERGRRASSIAIRDHLRWRGKSGTRHPPTTHLLPLCCSSHSVNDTYTLRPCSGIFHHQSMLVPFRQSGSIPRGFFYGGRKTSFYHFPLLFTLCNMRAMKLQRGLKFQETGAPARAVVFASPSSRAFSSTFLFPYFPFPSLPPSTSARFVAGFWRCLPFRIPWAALASV